MKTLNRVELIGYLGNDPEIKTLENNNRVANFRLATDDSYKDKNKQKVEQTDWHNIVAWRTLVDIIEKILKKGSYVRVEGKLKNRQWEDKDGQKRYTSEVVIDKLIALDPVPGQIEKVEK